MRLALAEAALVHLMEMQEEFEDLTDQILLSTE
jgi:hypothetical protein